MLDNVLSFALLHFIGQAMASTFSTQKTALDEIAQKIQSNRQRLNSAKALAAAAVSELGGMVQLYGGITQDIDAALVAEPNDAAVKVLKAEKDKLVAEFQTLQAAANSMATAVNAINY